MTQQVSSKFTANRGTIQRMKTLPTPYYDSDGITIYHGDCREILPLLEPADVVITDPVWPNSTPELVGADDPHGLFTAAAVHFPALAKRVVIQMGCNSDPRFLQGIPSALPFFRICWLEYVQPSYQGRLLYTGDVAYVFGTPPPSKVGARVLPGRFIQTDSTPKRNINHPSPRRIDHVKWLVKWFANGLIVDPFLGSGTTTLAAQQMGYRAIGIEIEERYCEIAVQRLAQQVLPIPA